MRGQKMASAAPDRAFIQRIVGMTNCAPARMPVGQRDVTVLRRV
jgi:hypothetical protein